MWTNLSKVSLKIREGDVRCRTSGTDTLADHANSERQANHIWNIKKSTKGMQMALINALSDTKWWPHIRTGARATRMPILRENPWQVKATMVGKEEDSGKEKLLTAQAQQYLQLSPASSFQSYKKILRSMFFTLCVVIPPLTWRYPSLFRIFLGAPQPRGTVYLLHVQNRLRFRRLGLAHRWPCREQHMRLS